jgi:hypothetical protein
MEEEKNPKQTNDHPKVDPQDLRVIYNSLATYSNAVVTFRFTTLSFFLAAVAFSLGGTPSFGKYLLLAVITFSLYIVELRNRFLKNELGEEARQIQKKWGYAVNKSDDYKPEPVYILKFRIKNRVDNFTKSGITHSFALDILYFSVFIYALINLVILLIPIIKSLVLYIETFTA